jgi:hypothetical protein
LDHESPENFLVLQQHVGRFQTANEVEVGMIEEMCAVYWRDRRAWAIDTALLDKHIALQPGETGPERIAAAFDRLAAAPTLPPPAPLRDPSAPHVSARPPHLHPASNSQKSKRPQSHFRTPAGRNHTASSTWLDPNISV